jgi:hypothetical protein
VNSVAATALAIGVLAAPPAKPPPDPPASQLKQLMDTCDAHKFETIVDTTLDGKPHKSRVRLCGKEGQSDADWIGTLKDAIAKLRANKEMDLPVRDQIITAIETEIDRLDPNGPPRGTLAQGPPAAVPRLDLPLETASGEASAPPLAPEYSSLPPLPTTPPPPPRVLTPAMTGGVAGTSTSIRVPTGPAPKLSFACFSPGDIGGAGPCTEFDRETMLTVSAHSDVGKGVALRFLRNGEQRAEVDLTQLRPGKSLRIALPRQVCQGVGDGRLDLQVVEDGAEVKSDGPYALRC